MRIREREDGGILGKFSLQINHTHTNTEHIRSKTSASFKTCCVQKRFRANVFVERLDDVTGDGE